MKSWKKKTLVVTLGAVVFVGGFTCSIGAAPTWYTNYLQGKSTPAGSGAVTSKPVTNPAKQPVNNEKNTDTTPTKSQQSINDYWRNGGWTNGGTTTTSNTTPTENKRPDASSDTNSTTLSGVSAEETKLFQLLNAEREKRGLSPLQMNSELVRLARMKAKDMAELNYFSHTSPTYGKAVDMIRDAGIPHWIAGENIAITSSAQRANQLFMGSSVHRSTMLNRNYDQIGIGMYRKANGSLYVCEMFIGLR